MNQLKLLLDVSRFLGAWLLTVVALGGPIYSLSLVKAPAILFGDASQLFVGTRPSTILNFLTGTFDPSYVGLFLVGALLTMTLSFTFNSKERNKTGAWVFGLVVLLSWILANAFLYRYRFDSGIAFPSGKAIYIFGGLWLPWLGWIGFWPIKWRNRFLILICLFLVGPCLVIASCQFNMSGNELVDIAFVSKNSDSIPVAESTVALEKKVVVGIPTEFDFPQFRGPDREGTAPFSPFKDDWKSNPPAVRWRRKVGFGRGGFAIVGNYGFTQDLVDDQERVVCYRLSDGEPIWIHSDPVVKDSYGGGGPGPRATPTVFEGLVYTIGATGLLNCLDCNNGELVWAVDTLAENSKSINSEIERPYECMFGVAGSPLVTHNKVFVSLNGEDRVSLVAFEADSGKLSWRSRPRYIGGYCSPTLATLSGIEQVLDFGSQGLSGHDLNSGELLWEFPWSNAEKINGCQPLLCGQDRILLSTKKSLGTVMIEIKLSEEGTWVTKELWRSNAFKCEFNSPVKGKNSEYGYAVNDGVLTCLDLDSGERVWRKGRYGRGQVIRIGAYLLVQCERGDVALVNCSPKSADEVSSLKALRGTTWNYPAISGRVLIVRNDDEAICFELQQ